MKCPKCESDNREGMRFCEECGAKLELECPDCKAKIPLGKKFCGECGHDLTKPVKAPLINYSEPQSYTPKFLAESEYAEKIKKDYSVNFQMRMGLNSGPVVGCIGDDLRIDYTAVGDTTNLASRMESMARPGTILVSKNTYRLTRDFFEFKSLGEV
ncbi:MAG: zinc ribbon domain-containing protein [Desulfobacterales bacterium]|nr:MAG: zinc ribbon domain-containing protein [Desulfobacterales bacterium]